MTITSLPGGSLDLQEPDWDVFFPAEPEAAGMGQEWRGTAHRYWLQLAAELRGAETLAPTNGHAMCRLVLSYCRYDHAARQVLARGAVMPSPRTQVPQHNLWRDEMRGADSDATTLEMELCLTPRRRGGASKVRAKPRAAIPAESYLKRA